MERDENLNGKHTILINLILGDYSVCFLEGRCCACGVNIHIRVSREDGVENGSIFQEGDNKFFGKCWTCSRYSTPIGKITDEYLALRCVGAIMKGEGN